MFTWLESYLRATLDRYLNNERGQDVLVVLLILLVVWLLVAGKRIIVQ